MGSSRNRSKPLAKKNKKSMTRKGPKDLKCPTRKNKPLFIKDDTEALRQQLLEDMLPDISYTPDSQDRLGKPPYYIVMRIYAGVEESDTLDIRSDDAGVLHCIGNYAERHGVWIESSTVKDPDLADCHRIWVVDDPLQHRPFPAMLPILFMKFIERVLGYERVYASVSLWMFERTSPFGQPKKE